MLLTVREAAALLNRSPRTLRAQLARGDLEGTKRAGRWFVEQGALPVQGSRRARLDARAAQVRDVVEVALQRRMKRPRGLDLLESARHWILELEAQQAPVHARQAAALRELEAGYLHACRGVLAFHPNEKVPRMQAARAAWSRAWGQANLVPGPLAPWGRAIEAQLLPSIAGLLRWCETLSERSRP